MSDPFTFFHIESSKTNCVQGGLTIVYPTVFFKRHDDVLIKQRRISGWSLRVSTPGDHLPGAGPKVPLPGSRSKGCGEPAVGHADDCGHQLCEECPVRFEWFQVAVLFHG